MTETVERVTLERPTLERLTFCIPGNLGSGTSGGRRLSQRQKYEARTRSWAKAGASGVEFHLVQGSDLLDRLSMPKHAGRRWFWFNEPYLSHDRLEQLYAERHDVAGDKYRPELQVDLPIEADIQALGLSEVFIDELEGHRADLERAAQWLTRPSNTAHDFVTPAGARAAEASTRLRQIFRDVAMVSSVADPLQDLASEADSALDALVTATHERLGLDDSQLDDAGRPRMTKRSEDERTELFHVRRVEEAIGELVHFLRTPRARAARRGAYFLTGPAGAGKTHLLLDAVRKSLEEFRPAVVLFGQRFGDDLWSSVAEQLGMPQLGQDEILGALDACGEASGRNGR